MFAKNPFVLGPVSVYAYRFPTLKKSWLLFGDLHHFEVICSKSKKPQQKITAFFETINKRYKEKKIDYFIEAPWQSPIRESKEIPPTPHQKNVVDVETVFQDWKRCLTKNKKDCSFPSNIRAHYLDIRRHPILPTLEHVYVLREKLRRYRVAIQKSEMSDRTWTTIHLDLLSLFETLYDNAYFYYDESWFQTWNILRSPSLQNANQLVKLVYHGLKIDKQIKNIVDPHFRDILHTYWKEQMESPLTLVYNWVKQRKIPTLSLVERMNYLDHFLKAISILAVTVMDFYSMARMLRSFKDDDPETWYYCIAYMGQTHVANIDTFLSSQLGVEPYLLIAGDIQDIREKKKDCLNTQKFNVDEFFSFP